MDFDSARDDARANSAFSAPRQPYDNHRASMADDGESDAPLVPKPEPKHDVGVCRLMLLGLVLLVVLSYSALLIEDHILSSPATAQNRKAKTDLKSSWLKLHNPKTAHHDAELLRRRMLAGLVELPPSQLAEHVPAIAASLDHEDQHIRALAISMLGRLEPPAIAEHSDAIAARLARPSFKRLYRTCRRLSIHRLSF